jgi:hypothetical protein
MSGPQAPGGWEWPDELIDRPEQSSSRETETNTRPQTDNNSYTPANGQPKPSRERHWRPRTCRICLEVVPPTYNPPSENLPGFMQSGPSVTYETEDGGRLLRPCHCKGTSKYVHEGCLQAWRHSNPDYARRNYWECPTCGYHYRLQRLGWSRAISSIGKCFLDCDFANKHMLIITVRCPDSTHSTGTVDSHIRSWIHCRPHHRLLLGPFILWYFLWIRENNSI